ncbi:MAG: hypothetical protein LBP64_06215 [Tannerella sp.]|nr:hypothetical protein [Tannerella sp.]
MPIIGLFILASCLVTEHEESTFKRTVLVYIGRDNSLGNSSEEKIESLMHGWNGKNGNLIIYQDMWGAGAALQEIYVENGIAKTKEIYARASENSASPEVFARVLREVVATYPADSYGLIVFSHASGWLPDDALTSPRTLIEDVPENARMSLTGFASAIPDGRFDFIVFEACFMAGIEVAYELRNKTKYIVASSAEMLSPGFRDTYETSLNALFKKEAGLTEFAAKAYEVADAKTGDFRSATLSVIETKGLLALSNWLRDNISPDGAENVNIEEIQHFNRSSAHLFFDFEDYFSRILKNDGAKDELKRLIDNCVLYRAATPEFMPSPEYMGFKIEKHSGMTTYIRQSKYPYMNGKYETLEWFKKIYIIN